MFPFWDLVVEPVIEASGGRKIVEIGALRGETTVRMLDRLGPDAEIHVIDPAPVFDPSEHRERFQGRYHFYKDLSHNVLPDLEAMDVALVDGDHNWYTVYHELRMLAEAAHAAGVPPPILVLHDVAWPYGRRDLYYAPEQIPDEFRQPYAQLGMLRGVSDLIPSGGMNPTMFNATSEGGPRNGVMTALDDYLDETDVPFRLVTVPLYFGLAIAVPEARLEGHPELVRVLDHVESAEGRLDLIELAEDLRLEVTTMQHGLFFGMEKSQKEAAGRFLDLLKGALLNEHYVEHELRIHQLVRSLENGNKPYGESLRDPTRQWADQTRELLNARKRGQLNVPDEDLATYFPYTSMGRARLDRLQECVETIRTESIPGDLVECGTGRGGGAIFLRACLAAYNMPQQLLWVADRYRAAPDGSSAGVMPAPDGPVVPGGGAGFPDLLGDLNIVRDGFARFGLYDFRLRFLQGAYAETLPDAEIESISLLHLGAGIGNDTATVLEALYDKVAVGGYVVIERYRSPKVQQAVDDFRQRHGIDAPIEKTDWASSMWRVTERLASPPTVSAPAKVDASRVPLAPATALGTVDLTVVAVFHNMRREAERTLHSMSRAYQQGLEGSTYEVIVIDNGSDEAERLGNEFVSSFGPEFRYVELTDDASPSPVPALNLGVRLGVGKSFALMIDGAHLLTPGVLRFGLDGLRTYAPAIVATQQWFVGPGEQGDMIAEGYDQDFEDKLFEQIQWPMDGYRMFDIGTFIGERDWLDGMWESNCLFVPREVLAQAGAFDEAFDIPGGGYANLDVFERLGSAPDVTLVTILGEGSFHQVHGGTTTNITDLEHRHFRLGEYSKHFEDLRGRPFRGNRKQIHYVGTMRPEAARTRPRRRSVPNLFKFGRDADAAIPTEASPMPRELRDEFTEAYWKTLQWKKTTWLNQPVPRPPTDLFAYQELLAQVRPDWVVETGTGNGGRAWFLATVLDLLGGGQVLSVDADERDDRPDHDRITYLQGDPCLGPVLKQVRDIVGREPKALVILGSRGDAGRTITEFRLYEPIVPVGSYVIVEDTVVNGHPIWPDFGPGPAEAVKGVVESRGDFVSDLSMSKYGLSFNPGGFLKRVRRAQ